MTNALCEIVGEHIYMPQEHELAAVSVFIQNYQNVYEYIKLFSRTMVHRMHIMDMKV